MRSIVTIFFLTAMAGAVAQSPGWPGGVAGARIWNVMDTTGGSPGLRSLLTGTGSQLPGVDSQLRFAQGANGVGYLNFRPALLFSGNQQLHIDLGNQQFAGASYFTVYRCTDTARENSIWYITGNSATDLILTTNRMADLGAYKYMNYIDVVRGNPKVNTYVQQKQKDTTQVIGNAWHIGYKPGSPSLPLKPFAGMIPEIVAYDRALSGQERVQVASYLALKYGITLSEPNATYLNSAGEKIWDGLKYTGYHHNIAGIGRDDSSGLLQRIACSGNTPGLLTVSTTQAIADRSFLLWGDNDHPLEPDQKTGGMPRLLQKKWLVITHDTHPYITDLRLDTRLVDAPLPVDPVFWLAIDHSGTANFNQPGIQFIRMTSLDPQGQALFQGVTWNAAGGGKEAFGIIAAQGLLLATTIDSPSCAAGTTGTLHVQVLGGDPPYRLVVTANNGTAVFRDIPSNGQTQTISNLPAGKYRLRVTDSLQETYSDSFYITNSDAPQLQAVAANYTLPADGLLIINAADGMPDGLSYEWTGAGNFQAVGPQIVLSKPGVYTVSCSKGGCSGSQDVTVAGRPYSVFSDVVLYPNPSADVFNVSVTLDSAAAVRLSVYTVDGHLVSSQTGTGRSNYLFTGSLGTAGQYEIVLNCGLSIITKQLIITK